MVQKEEVGIMCRKLIVVNELYLGARQLGWEAYSLPKGEIVEFTDKQLRNLILTGKEEVYGLAISEETGELIPDTENFYCRNWMVKSHINSLIPKFENDSLVNLFYIVTGTHKEKGIQLYDVISSRYERTSFSEERIKALYEMGIISGGLKVEGNTLKVAPLEKKSTTETKAESKEEKEMAS